MRRFGYWCIWLLVWCGVSASRENESQSGYVPGRLMVKFSPTVSPASQSATLRRHGITSAETVGVTGWTLAFADTDEDLEELAAEMTNLPEIVRAEPDYFRYFSLTNLTNDPLWGVQWHHQNTGQQGGGTRADPQVIGQLGADINSVAAWRITASTGPVVVAVIDSGADLNHPDLKDALWTNPGEIPDNGRDDDGNGFIDDYHGFDFVGANVVQPKTDSDPSDEEGHGTAVMGCIAAVPNNATGVAGSGWPLQVMVLKAGDKSNRLSVSAIVSALEYARRMGAVAVNASFGGDNFSWAEYEAIKNLTPAMLVAAAGNRRMDIDRSPVYPAGYDLENLISVGATDRLDQPAFFTNYGRNKVHLFAPGLGVLTTLCTYDPTPDGESSWDRAAPRFDLNGDGLAEYGFMSGTSFSAPLVTGVVGMMRAMYPGERPAKIRQRLMDATTPLDWATQMCVSGGRLDSGQVFDPRPSLDWVKPNQIIVPPIVPDTLTELVVRGRKLPDNPVVWFEPAGIEVVGVTPVVAHREMKITVKLDAAITPGSWDLVLQHPRGTPYRQSDALRVLPTPFFYEQLPMTTIPDNQPYGRIFTLEVPEHLIMDWLEVEVDINHPYPYDLQVLLESPSGTQVVLHQTYTGFPQPDINGRYPNQTQPAEPLTRLLGESCQGVWTLKVNDTISGGSGLLMRWALRVYSFDSWGPGEGPATPTATITPLPTATPVPPPEAVLITFEEPVVVPNHQLSDEYQYLGLRFPPESKAFIRVNNLFENYAISHPMRLVTFNQNLSKIGEIIMEMVDPQTGAPGTTDYFELTTDYSPSAWGMVTAFDQHNQQIAQVLPHGRGSPIVVSASGIAKVIFKPGPYQDTLVGFDNLRFIPPGPTLPVGDTPTPGAAVTATATRPPTTPTPVPAETPIVVWGHQPYQLDFPDEFTFPFAGKDYERVYIYPGGFVTMEYNPAMASRGWVDLLFSPVPVISAHGGWLYPEKAGSVAVTSASEQVTISFRQVPGSSLGHYPNTFSMTLKSDGRFELRWQDLRSSPSFVGFGIGPSGVRSDWYVDLSRSYEELGDGNQTAIYEMFAGIAPDISHRANSFAPVRATPAPTHPAPPTLTPTNTPAVPRPTPFPWETPLPLEDDDGVVWVEMPGGFQFGDQVYGRFRVSANGYLVFGTQGGGGVTDQPVIDTAEKLHARSAPTMVFWGQDLDLSAGGLVAVSTVESGLRVRFAQVPERRFDERVNDCAVVLLHSGAFVWEYGQIGSTWGVAGYTLGGGVEPSPREVSLVDAIGPVNTGNETVLWEAFGTENPVNISGQTIRFRPVRAGTPLPTWTMTATPTASRTPTPIPIEDLPFFTDINRDGVVDAKDLLLFMQSWHQTHDWNAPR